MIVEDSTIDKILQYHNTHPSIAKIKENFQNSQNNSICEFNPITSNLVFNLLKSIDEKKATGIDKIPPKLVKLAAGILCRPLMYGEELQNVTWIY